MNCKICHKPIEEKQVISSAPFKDVPKHKVSFYIHSETKKPYSDNPVFHSAEPEIIVGE